MQLEMQVIEVDPAEAQRDDLGGTPLEMKPHRVKVAVPLRNALHEATYFGAGARVCRNPLIIDCDPDELRIGDKVEVVFEKVSDTLAVPRFRPI
jgi:hypothetical protein